MDRLRGLLVFVRVVETGGFAAAGKRLSISATMVSKHIQQLEERLGTRLLNRTTRKVDLTEVGKEYYQRCVQILSDIEQADAAAAALKSTPRGVLRIYVASQVVHFVAPVVTEYLRLYKQSQIELTGGVREVDLVDEGIDLAVRLSVPADSSFIVRDIAKWRHVVCASPAYLLERGRPQSLSDLENHNCMRHVLYPYQNEWHFTDKDGAPQMAHVSGNLVTNSGDALHIAALGGRGIFLAPGFIVADDIRSGRLVRLFEHLKPTEMTMSAVYPHRHQVSAKVRGFIDLLVAHAADHRRLLDPPADRVTVKSV